MEQWASPTRPEAVPDAPAECPDMPMEEECPFTGDLLGDEFDDGSRPTTLDACKQALLDPRLDARRLGELGELAARLWLHDQSWIILDANWRCRYGELDIVALTRHHSIVFVEVKTRRSTLQGSPQEAVHTSKQSNIRRTATLWLQRYGRRISHVGIRFDVITCVVHDGAVELQHIVEAF